MPNLHQFTPSLFDLLQRSSRLQFKHTVATMNFVGHWSVLCRLLALSDSLGNGREIKSVLHGYTLRGVLSQFSQAVFINDFAGHATRPF